jgi:hypothetical protein
MTKLLVLPLLLLAVNLRAVEVPITVHIQSSLPSPQQVGTPIGFTALPALESMSKGWDTYVYQYSVSVNGGPFRIVRDFSQKDSFAWAPELFGQSAKVRVVVRNNTTKATGQAELPFQIVSRVKGTAPVVTPTSHPLVALFSAPACPTGAQFRVAFHADGEEATSWTPSQPCSGTLSNNVYVAGMRADTDYRLRSEVVTKGKTTTGDYLPFHTGMLDGSFPPVSVLVPPTSASDNSVPVTIFSAESLDGSVHPFATDLQGRIIWYLRTSDVITRVIPGGHFLVQGDGSNSVNDEIHGQLLREMDLAGNVVRETNIGRVAEQLESRGIHSDCQRNGRECVSGFHHEAIRLPNGHTLAVAGIERMMPTGTQGSKHPVDVLGDVIIDLDEDFQVAGIWNSFDHEDINRKSLNDSKCHTGGGDGCPAVQLADDAYGWLHSNSLNYIPSTGDFLVSQPEQNWVLKVDWKDGKGSGKVLWRLGKDGDFKVESKDPNPWFAFQHDAGFEPVGSDLLTLTDDGAVTGTSDKPGVRGQVWKLDEDKHIATLVYNAPLGVGTICCGTMQTLKTGGYMASAGWSLPLQGRTVEFDREGKVVFALEVMGALDYRSYRVQDMYSAPVK